MIFSYIDGGGGGGGGGGGVCVCVCVCPSLACSGIDIFPIFTWMYLSILGWSFHSSTFCRAGFVVWICGLNLS